MASNPAPLTMFQEMCKGAQKLQDLWEPRVGDRVLLDCGERVLKLVPKGKEGMVWLPYDHQMYEMLEVNNSSTMSAFIVYWNFREGHNTNPSIAQLWLEIVMESLFDQTWNGREFADMEIRPEFTREMERRLQGHRT